MRFGLLLLFLNLLIGDVAITHWQTYISRQSVGMNFPADETGQPFKWHEDDKNVCNSNCRTKDLINFCQMREDIHAIVRLDVDVVHQIYHYYYLLLQIYKIRNLIIVYV